MHLLPPRPDRPSSRHLAAYLAALALVTAPAFAAELAATAPEVPVLPGEITRTVIEQGENRTILIEMVPDLTPRPARQASVTTNPIQPPIPAPSAPTPEEAEANAKPYHSLNWIITVYPGPVPCSVIEGETAGLGPWRVISNIDFNLLNQSTTFTSARAIYDWFPFISEDAPESPNRPALAALGLAATPAAYRIAPGSQNPGPDALDALTLIHAHHDAHRDTLRADYLAREAAAAAHERELRENPPKKPDNVVRFSNPDLLRSLQLSVAP